VPQSTILWNLNAICPRVAELERCNRFSNCRAFGVQIGTMDLKVGGPSAWVLRQIKDIGAIRYCFSFWIFFAVFKLQRLECEWGRKMGQNFAKFLTPFEKKGRAIKYRYTIFCATYRFYALVYFLYDYKRRFGHIKCMWVTKKRRFTGKHIAFSNLRCRRLKTAKINVKNL